jgi:hypothetical protein
MAVGNNMKNERWLAYSYEVYNRFISFTAFSPSTGGDNKNNYIPPAQSYKLITKQNPSRPI